MITFYSGRSMGVQIFCRIFRVMKNYIRVKTPDPSVLTAAGACAKRATLFLSAVSLLWPASTRIRASRGRVTQRSRVFLLTLTDSGNSASRGDRVPQALADLSQQHGPRASAVHSSRGATCCCRLTPDSASRANSSIPSPTSGRRSTFYQGLCGDKSTRHPSHLQDFLGIPFVHHAFQCSMITRSATALDQLSGWWMYRQ